MDRSDLIANLFTALSVIMYSDILGTIDLYVAKFGVSAELSGVFIGIMPVAGAFTGIPIVLLARRFQIKTIILTCVFLGMCFNLVYALGYAAPNVAPVLLARIFLGAFVTSNQLSAMFMSKKYNNAKALDLAGAAFNATTLLGYALGPLFSAVFLYGLENATGDVFNRQTASGWFDLGLCVLYFACVLCFLREPERELNAVRIPGVNTSCYVMNLLVAFLQATAYSVWYVNTAVVRRWFGWTVQSTLLLVSILVAFQIPAQFVTCFRNPPMWRMLTLSLVSAASSLLLLPYNIPEPAQFVLYIAGSIVYGSSSMLVHAINFIINKPIAPRPKDVFVGITSIVYMLGISVGAVSSSFLRSPYSAGVLITSLSVASVVVCIVQLCMQVREYSFHFSIRM